MQSGGCGGGSREVNQEVRLQSSTCKCPLAAVERLFSSAMEDPIAVLPVSSWLCRPATVRLTSSVLRCVNEVSIAPICSTSLACTQHRDTGSFQKLYNAWHNSLPRNRLCQGMQCPITVSVLLAMLCKAVTALSCTRGVCSAKKICGDDP